MGGKVKLHQFISQENKLHILTQKAYNNYS